METIEQDESEQGVLQRHRGKLLAGGALLVATAAWLVSGRHAPTRPAPPRPVTVVSLPPPPPPPPRPEPKPRPESLPVPEETQMVEQTPLAQPEEKPQEPPSAPKDNEPAGALGTNVKGSGPVDGFGLSGSGNGNGLFGNGNGAGGGGRGGRWGWYASQVQTQIQEALGTNKKTRTADLLLTVRVWPDLAGRITRAQLVNSTGDAALDEAVKNEVLVGLTLKEPPPADLPLPIVFRITARRP